MVYGVKRKAVGSSASRRPVIVHLATLSVCCPLANQPVAASAGGNDVSSIGRKEIPPKPPTDVSSSSRTDMRWTVDSGRWSVANGPKEKRTQRR